MNQGRIITDWKQKSHNGDLEMEGLEESALDKNLYIYIIIKEDTSYRFQHYYWYYHSEVILNLKQNII